MISKACLGEMRFGRASGRSWTLAGGLAETREGATEEQG
jgi:hypothetical protein